MSDSRVNARALYGGGALMVLAVFVIAGIRERHPPSRCASGFVERGPRCCGAGQALVKGRCSGAVSECPAGWQRATGARQGCVFTPRRTHVFGGRVSVAPNDWEAVGRSTRRSAQVPAFDIDVAEVDHTRWSACANAGRCRTLPDSEPGLPVTGVTPDEAAEYCRFAGGQLPTSDEWVLAAAGDASRRFPWGNTGLVCRRAAYGLVRGPCAQQGVGPELPGSRPDGATPTGIVDLIGNVAEWSREPNGKAVARGGSFRSRVVSQLRTWSFEPLSSAADHVGFRCVYAPNPPQPNSAAALDGGSAEP